MPEQPHAFCPDCQIKFRAAARYCGKCGKRLQQNATVVEMLDDAMNECTEIAEIQCGKAKHSLIKETSAKLTPQVRERHPPPNFCTECGEKL